MDEKCIVPQQLCHIVQLTHDWKFQQNHQPYPFSPSLVTLNCPYEFSSLAYYENDPNVFRNWRLLGDFEKMLKTPLEKKPTSHNVFRQSTHYIPSKPKGRVVNTMYIPRQVSPDRNLLIGTYEPLRIEFYIPYKKHDSIESYVSFQEDISDILITVSVYTSFQKYLENSNNPLHTFQYSYRLLTIETLGTHYIHIRYKQHTNDTSHFFICPTQFATVTCSNDELWREKWSWYIVKKDVD